MIVYLDTCCWNRLFDRPQIGRVKLETDAVLELLALAEQGNIKLIWSSVLEYEIANNPNNEIADAIKNVAKICETTITLTEDIVHRASIISSYGIDYFDALHFACSEKSNADIFATVDDKLLKRISKITTHVRCVNPLTYIIQGI